MMQATMTHDARSRYQPTSGAANPTMMTSPAIASRQRAYLVMPQEASRSPCPWGGGGGGMLGGRSRRPSGAVLPGIAGSLPEDRVPGLGRAVPDRLADVADRVGDRLAGVPDGLGDVAADLGVEEEGVDGLADPPGHQPAH